MPQCLTIALVVEWWQYSLSKILPSPTLAHVVVTISKHPVHVQVTLVINISYELNLRLNNFLNDRWHSGLRERKCSSIGKNVTSSDVWQQICRKISVTDKRSLCSDTGFGNYDNKDGNWGGPPRDAAFNSFGGRSDRSKSAFFNDRGAGSRGRWVKLFHLIVIVNSYYNY